MMQATILDINMNFFHQTFLGEELSSYLWFAGIIIATLLLKRTFTGLLARSGNMVARIFARSTNYKYRLGQLIRKPLGKLMQVILYFIAIDQLDGLWSRYSVRSLIGKRGSSVHLDRIIDHIFLFLFIIFLAQLISRVIDYVYHIQADKARQEKNKERGQLLPLMKEIGKLLMWCICIFWILGSVFNVNVPALVTGLGIGGLAIALAAKESVENFFAALTILSDKPFEIGDTIRITNIEGGVERIGFRSTRIRSSDGAAHIVPNQKLVSENLVNLSRRDTRIVKVGINIKYGVPRDELMKMIDELKKTLATVQYVRAPIDALLENFGKNTFQLNVSYSLPYPLPAGSTVDNVKQEVNIRIYDIVSKYAAFYINTQQLATEEEDKEPPLE